jgi:hypothetical protein
LDALWAQYKDTWVTVKQAMQLDLGVGRLSVRARLEGLAGADYLDRRKVLGARGYQLEFRVNEKGRQHVRPQT